MGSYFTFLSGCFVFGGFCLIGLLLGFFGLFIFWRGLSVWLWTFWGFLFRINLSDWKRPIEIRNTKYTKANTTCASTEIGYTGNASGLGVL